MTEPNGAPVKRFDLAKLAEASRPTTVTTAGNLNGPDNPFLPRVRASYEQDKREYDSGWQELPITSDQFGDVVASLRALSQWFGSTKNGKKVEPIGVHIRAEYQPDGMDHTVEVGPKDFDDIPDDGREVFVKYTGRERLARGRKGRRADATADAGAASARVVDDDETYDDEPLGADVEAATA